MALSFAWEVGSRCTLDRQAGVGRELAGIADLFARQCPARFDEPAGRDLLLIETRMRRSISAAKGQPHMRQA
jgi:hypothetical protein